MSGLDNFDELISTAEILLTNLKAADEDRGDGAMEAISILLMQLVHMYGATHPVTQALFPNMNVIKQRIDSGNYLGATWDSEALLKALQEIRSLIAQQQ